MSEIKLTVDDKPVTVAAGATILDAAKAAGKDIPTLKSLSVAGLLAEAMKRIHRSESVSSLFDEIPAPK